MVLNGNVTSVKGCTALLSLTKPEAVCGDVVQGQLTLKVSEAIELQGIFVELLGDEILRVEICEDGSTQHQDIKHRFLSQEVLLPFTTPHGLTFVNALTQSPIIVVQIPLLTPSQTSLNPGDHVFPFTLPLAAKHPGTLQTKSASVLGWSSVVDAIEYGVAVHLQPKGLTRAKSIQIAHHAFVARAASLPQAKYPGHAAKDDTKQRVTHLCCLYKGMCELVLSTECDTTDVGDGRINLRASVQNNTTEPIRALTLSLEQCLTLYIPEQNPHAGSRAGWSQVVLEQTFDHEIAPHSGKDDIPLSVAIADVLAYQRSTTSSVLIPTSKLNFMSIGYRVTAKVVFANAALTTNVDVDLLVTLLHVPGHGSPQKAGEAVVVTAPAAPSTITNAPVAAAAPVYVRARPIESSSDEEDEDDEESGDEPVAVSQVELHP